MAALIGRIYRLLTEGTVEQRIAAAIVLGELAPREKVVVKHLASAASDENLTLRLKAIEALGKIGTPQARDILYPLLDEEGGVRQAAARAVAMTGNPAVSFIKSTFPDAPLAKKRTLLQVLAALRTKEAMSVFLDVLCDPHVSIVREAVNIFREETARLESKERRTLSAHIRTTLKRKGFASNRNAVDAAILLLSHLRDPASAKLLLKHSGADHPPIVRRYALQGLRWVLPEAKSRDSAVALLLKYLEEDDFQNLVSPALEALQPLDVPTRAADLLIQLSQSRHPLVRKFALTKMSRLSQVRVTRALVSALSDSDPMIRELASRSLRAQGGAWKVIIEGLRTCEDVDLGWRMVHAVKQEGARIPGDTLKKVAQEAVGRLEDGDPIADPMLNLVRTLAPRVHFEVLHKRGLQWKRKKQFAEAELCLKPLTRNELCTDDARFDLAIVSLKNSHATAGAITRDSDLALSLIKGLVQDPDFPLVKRLRAEKRLLEREDFYYLGFHLVEGSPDERALGTDILQTIVKETPRSKVGKSAKSKLKIEGLV